MYGRCPFFLKGQPWLWWPDQTWCFTGQQEHHTWRGPRVKLPIGAVAALRIHGKKFCGKWKKLVYSFIVSCFCTHWWLQVFDTEIVASLPQSPFPVALCPGCEIRNLQPLVPGPLNLMQTIGPSPGRNLWSNCWDLSLIPVIIFWMVPV